MTLTRRKTSAREPGEILDLARACARAADEKKGEDIVILDLRKLTFITDYFVITNGANPRQVDAIAAAVQDEMRKRGARPIGRQGTDASGWILLDYADFVVHVFDAERRKLYDLGLLWGDAPRVEWR